MAQVTPIQRKDPLQTVLPIAGAVIGGVSTGSVQGAGAGAGLGSVAAGALGQGPQTAAVPESDGMKRRQAQISQDPLQAITQAQAALEGLPPEQFPETRRALEQAQALARRNQELGAQGRV